LVYPSPGQTGETIQEQVITPYNEAASSYKKILKYTLVGNELPRTRLGKLKRFELPGLAASPERSAAGAEEPDSPEYREIKKHLLTYVSTDVLPDDHLEFDLALDSLQRVSLMAFLRDSFGVKVDDKMLQQYPTVRKLSDQMRAWKVKFNTKAITDWAEILKEKVSFTLPRSTGIHSFLQRILKAMARSCFRIKGSGTENIPDDPCIFVPNHQSYLDSMFVTVLLRTRRVKQIFFFAKSKHVRSRLARALADRCNIIVMDMENDLKGSIQKLAHVLQGGKSIMIFPEGTRSPDGVLGEFKKTFAILSCELDVPVVPVVINGAYEVLPRGSRLPRLHKRVTVDFLPPVQPSDDSYDELNEKIRTLIGGALNS
ncbi:MAG: 1-acyl-sn-glycerol-3-phosphate acyltransferase, partial [Kiritimatiellales bacterium]|nr:1-acyl-sn-glycerol-3-phosphate acyltransferase [Kiritimatiellales bacterium]